MAEHTPGLWRVQDRTVFALNIDGVNRFHALAQGGFTDERHRTTDEELRANARLIAAGPDMLNALHRVVEQFGNTHKHLLAIEKAWDAIAKAEGTAT
jgi:hypothetical protein